jgi:hypothetical protein
MLSRAALLLLAANLAAGCGAETGDEPTVTTALPPASTAASTTSSSAPVATVPNAMTTTATTSPPSTSPPTTTSPRTTTTTAAPAPWPEPGFPPALPPELIPWDEVGAGWLLVDYAPPSAGQSGVDPGTTRAVFLVDQEDNWYGAWSWPGPGLQVLDWSPDGRRLLALDYRRYPALSIIDLYDRTTATVPVHSAGEYRISSARFTRPAGRDIVVHLIDDWNRMRVRLETLHTDGTPFALLADLGLISSHTPQYVSGGLSWLYAASGTQVVVTTSDGIRLLDNQGVLLRSLDSPGPGCTLSRWWDERRVLAACWDPDWVASPCAARPGEPVGGRSLWVVPVDGSPAARVTPAPVCEESGTGSPQSAPEYTDAVAVGGMVAATHTLRTACSGGLQLLAGEAVTPWLQYPGSADIWWACDPELIAIRGDRLLLWDWVFADRPEHEQGFGVIFDVAADGTSLRLLSPVERGLFGGVLQVFTTEETALTVGPW